ncbi:MAG: DUF938 domain-containing protein [Alphaproteobacteria bacterium]
MADYDWPACDDGRIDAPTPWRNREPILEVLRGVLPERPPASAEPRPLVLEVGSGTGQHAAFMAEALPHIDWLPSEPDPRLRESIVAWSRHAAPLHGLANLLAPCAIDVCAADWGLGDIEAGRLCAIFSANMVHIAPWAAAVGLMAGAGRLLAPGAKLCLYGPFSRGGRHTAPSNAEFDASLRRRDPAWGVRDLDDMETLARANGLGLDEIVNMPANNLTLIFRKNRLPGSS